MNDDQFQLINEQLNKIVGAVVAIQADLQTKASAEDMHKVIDGLADIGRQYQEHQEDHALDNNRITRVERRLDELAQVMGYQFKSQ